MSCEAPTALTIVSLSTNSWGGRRGGQHAAPSPPKGPPPPPRVHTCQPCLGCPGHQQVVPRTLPGYQGNLAEHACSHNAPLPRALTRLTCPKPVSQVETAGGRRRTAGAQSRGCLPAVRLHCLSRPQQHTWESRRGLLLPALAPDLGFALRKAAKGLAFGVAEKTLLGTPASRILRAGQRS